MTNTFLVCVQSGHRLLLEAPSLVSLNLQNIHVDIPEEPCVRGVYVSFIHCELPTLGNVPWTSGSLPKTYTALEHLERKYL